MGTALQDKGLLAWEDALQQLKDITGNLGALRVGYSLLPRDLQVAFEVILSPC
jgi:hypothetical protein